MTLSITLLCIEFHYAECYNSFNVILSVILLSVIILSVIILGVILLSVIMLRVIMLSVNRLSVIMLSAVAPILAQIACPVIDIMSK
jgi:hypothetical protein